MEAIKIKTQEKKVGVPAAACAMWQEVVVSRITEIYGTNTQLLPKSSDCTWEQLKRYLVQSISDYLQDEGSAPESRPELNYTSEKMSLVEHLDFLIIESEKILFPSGERMMSGLLFDEYDIAQGLTGLKFILSHFIKCNDAAAS